VPQVTAQAAPCPQQIFGRYGRRFSRSAYRQESDGHRGSGGHSLWKHEAMVQEIFADVRGVSLVEGNGRNQSLGWALRQ